MKLKNEIDESLELSMGMSNDFEHAVDYFLNVD